MIADLHTGHETMATRPEQQQVADTMDGVEYVPSGGEESPALLMVHDSHSPRRDGSIIVHCSPGQKHRLSVPFGSWWRYSLQKAEGPFGV